MTTLLLSVLAATSLAAAGISAPGETRAAQSLPNEHLAVAPNSGAGGKLHPANRLADATADSPGSAESDKYKCEHRGGYWDDKKLRCRRALAWEVPGIGAATLAGLVYAITSGDGSGSGSGSATNSISH